jgi:hypothetical protein
VTTGGREQDAHGPADIRNLSLSPPDVTIWVLLDRHLGVGVIAAPH